MTTATLHTRTRLFGGTYTKIGTIRYIPKIGDIATALFIEHDNNKDGYKECDWCSVVDIKIYDYFPIMFDIVCPMLDDKIVGTLSIVKENFLYNYTEHCKDKEISNGRNTDLMNV
ncbi:hypothetical protein LAZ67_1002003 [Cordylochernes scorpioides]|uniref:Uncharacterized protein n=1 Tax=Cordylochernes scorpioides TaxID=51811 RepID=A0ABY6JVV1_9ARAC|nr:hypothetical protein LAZ67_1002003 [Cordylochernes scorpioides]